MTVFKGKKSSGVVPVTKGIFEEMKSRRRVSNKVTYNALLDIYEMSRRPNEAVNVLKWIFNQH